MVHSIGEPLTTRSAGDGTLSIRVATIFPRQRVAVTVPGIHITQYGAYADWQSELRVRRGEPPLSEADRAGVWMDAVDLLGDGESILIRPDPNRMALAFEADELLQEFFPKEQILFLEVDDPAVRTAIQHRGEAWRVRTLPKSLDEIKQHIAASRVAVHGRPIYYYCPTRGTRLLTFTEFDALGRSDDDDLRVHLAEIADLLQRKNLRAHPELRVFGLSSSDSIADLMPADVQGLDPLALRVLWSDLRDRLARLISPDLQRDDLEQPTWRRQMYGAIVGRKGDALNDRDLIGLGDEYFMQVHWLPGVRIENGEVIPEVLRLREPKNDDIIHGLICNVLRENGDIEWINIGRVSASLARRSDSSGRRDVFIVEFRRKEDAQDQLMLIRFHKWGVRERLDEGKPLLQAMIECEEYTDYVMDRRLACRQLGMNLPRRGTTHKMQERYFGTNRALHGTTIWSPYYQRAYIPGIASDKLSAKRLADDVFAIGLAELLGRAAASNLVVGRATRDMVPTFDDGDEIVIEDKQGGIRDIIVSDHTGAFNDFEGDLAKSALAYAGVIQRRAPHLSSPAMFAQTFCTAFAERLGQLQADYRNRPRAFEALMQHRRRDPAGNLAHRWALVLQRLDAADPARLARVVRDASGV